MIQRYSTEDVRDIVEQRTNNEYALIRVDKSASGNKKRMMSIRHNVCGHEYTLDIYEFIAGKRRCGKCKVHMTEHPDTQRVLNRTPRKGIFSVTPF
ncbi:hypothetical protein [Sulfurimonas sp. NWX79]|uniref:hypothetical protein n=1 Tax=Sulfurimonas sp. NWX79 TaxID=2925412 RepID=UPI003204B495